MSAAEWQCKGETRTALSVHLQSVTFEPSFGTNTFNVSPNQPHARKVSALPAQQFTSTAPLNPVARTCRYRYLPLDQSTPR